MKKILLVAVITIAALTSAKAQEGLKGTWFATAQLGYEDNGATTKTTFIPVVGTFIAPTTAVGLGAGVINVKPEKGDSSTITVVEPLVRQYWPVAGNLYFFGQAAVPMLFGDAADIYGVTITPGLDFVVNSWFTVEFSTTVASLSVTNPEVGDTTTNVSINPFAHSLLGTTSQIGFKFLF